MGGSHTRTAPPRGRIVGRALSALLAFVVLATSVRAGDPVFFAIVDGSPPELWRIRFNGQVLSTSPILDGGAPAAIETQSLAMGYDGSLWGAGNEPGADEWLYEWASPLTSATIASKKPLVLGGTISLARPIGMCADGPTSPDLFTSLFPNGGLYAFDPDDLSAYTSYGGPIAGDARALAKFPDEAALWFVRDSNQLFRYDLVSGIVDDYGIFTFLGTQYTGVQGLTAVPDDVTNGGVDTLYGIDTHTKRLLRIEPSQTASNVTSVIHLSSTPTGDVLNLAYYAPCDGGPWVDCNGNGVPDACELVQGTASDCDGNGVPDSCDPDCDGDGTSDACELAAGTEFDCNGNGIPDSCDIASGFSVDCDLDGIPDDCAVAAGTVPDCNANGIPDVCDIASGAALDCDGNGVPDTCDPDCDADGIPDGCEADCDGDGVPDECALSSGTVPDCNGNGIPDSCDVIAGTSADVDGNGVPDECESDCDGDGILDVDEIAMGTSLDCNGNQVPDECEPDDCDGDSIPDDCEADCNQNGVPDDCEASLLAVSGLSTMSSPTAPTSGGGLVTFSGSGFVDGAAGMSVQVVTLDEVVPIAPADILASPDGTQLTVVMPPIAPGCHCAVDPFVFAEVSFDNGCASAAYSSTGALFPYEASVVDVSDPNGVQAAVDVAVPGTCIVVASGANYAGEIVLDSSVERVTLTSDDPASPGSTNLDGSSVGGSIPPSPALLLVDTPATTCVHGFGLRLANSGLEVRGPAARATVSSCQIDDNIAAAGRGGGITVLDGAHPVLIGLDVKLNETAGGGGGLVVRQASATVVDCRFFSNIASGRGGEVWLVDTPDDFLMVDSLVSQDPLGAGGDALVDEGGGLAWEATNPQLPARGRLLRNTFLNNAAGEAGGGVWLGVDVGVRIDQNVFDGNRATSPTSLGGGLAVASENREEVVVCENVFLDNRSQVGGAMAFAKKNEGLVERNLVLCNRAVQNDPEGDPPADYFAAGVFLDDCAVELRNNTIYDNRGASTTQQGGGIHMIPTTGNPRHRNNVVHDNEGWEVFTATLPPLGDPLVDFTLAWDSTAPTMLFNDIFFVFGGLGTQIWTEDPQLVGPACVDDWSLFAPVAGSPTIGAGDDGTHLGAFVADDFVPGTCLAPAADDCNANGIPDRVDILAGISLDDDGDGVPDECATWVDLGQALAGAAGEPQLDVTGEPIDGEVVTFTLGDAAPSASATMVVGLSEASVPFKQGTLVPAPDVLLFGLSTDAAGQIVLPAPWPAGVPAGFATWYQWWIVDATGPKGFTASNAVVGTTP